MDWEVWKIVGSGLGKLEEIHSTWTIDDVASAHAWLDLQEDLDILQANQVSKEE